MTPTKPNDEAKELLDWARKNIPIKDLFYYAYGGIGNNKSLDDFRNFVNARRTPTVSD